MKKTLFLSALLGMVCAPAWADTVYSFPTDGTDLTIDTREGDRNLLLYNGADGGLINVAGNLDLGNYKVWIGSGNADADAQTPAQSAALVKISGAVSNNAAFTGEIGFAEWAANNGAHAIYVLTGDCSNLHGQMYVNHGGAATAYSQLVLGNGFNTAAYVTVEDKAMTVLHLQGSATIAGLNNGGANGVVTADSTAAKLTMNVANGANYTYSGTIGQGTYLTYGDEAYGTTTTSTAMNIAKSGAGTQTLSGSMTLGTVEVTGGTLKLSGEFTTTGATLTNSGSTLEISNGRTTNISTLTMDNGTTMKVTGANTNVTVNNFGANFDVKSPNFVLGDGATLTVNGKTWLKNATLRVKRTAAGNGGTMNLNGFLSGPDSTLNVGNLEVEQNCTLNITGTATASGTSDGFIIYNAGQHRYTINGTLNIQGGISAKNFYGGDATKTNAIFSVNSTGVLQLNKGITFETENSALTQLGTINVNGTLAIGGSTTGNNAVVNLRDGSKVVAIDSETSTEQVFTLTNQNTVNFSGKGLNGTADNHLIINSAINNDTAAVNSHGHVTFGDVTTVRLTVDGDTTTGVLDTPTLIMQAGSTLTMGAADTTINTVTLNAGSTITVGSADSHAYSLTTSNMTLAGEATINADLVTAAGATLNFTNSATVTLGCEVSFGVGTTITLDDSYTSTLISDGRVLLFTDVETLDLATLSNVTVTGNFTDGVLLAETYEVGGVTKYNIYATPEPATATLSLLALAGLCARRKRH